MNEVPGREILHHENIDKFPCLTDNIDYSRAVLDATLWTKSWRRSL